MDSDISSKGWLVRFSVPILIVIISTICFQFGVNVENIPDEDSKGILMHILYALSLFTLGGVSLGVPISGPLWAIRLLYVMYYLAPAVSLGALVEHLFTSARFYLRFKILKGNHFVIIGAGRVATQIPEMLNGVYKNNYKRTKLGIEVPIVVADKNKGALLSSLNKYNILSFNAEDAAIIKNLNFGKAKMIFILTDNDWVNVNLFFQLKKHFSSNSNLKRIPKIFIRIKSEDLLIELKKNHFESHCVFFNVHIEAIKLMMSDSVMKTEIYRNWLKMIKQSCPQTIVFLGFGRFGQHTLLSYLNNESETLKDSVNKVIIIS
jgi:Trk K+ transport system NAD-binding subunit